MNYITKSRTNLVLNKILSDNELKNEIPKMFNYTSNGNYVDTEAWNGGVLNNPYYITKGLYSNKDEDGTTYYYRGDVDNNNIQFGVYDEDYYVYYGKDSYDFFGYYQTKESRLEDFKDNCEPVKLASKGDKMYWKIVRINGDGSLRLIYNGTNENLSHSDIANSYIVGIGPINLNSDDERAPSYTYDNANKIDSFIKKEVDTWYNNVLGSNSSYDSKVILGRFCSDTSGYDNLYGDFAGAYRLSPYETDNITPTFICPDTKENFGGSYRLKAGLITADELSFAGEVYTVSGNGYLNTNGNGESYWTMTPYTPGYSEGTFFSSSFNVYEDEVDDNGSSVEYGIRPVINVSTDNMNLIGNGTTSSPYVLEGMTESTYKGTITIEEGSSADYVTAFEEYLNLDEVTWTSEDESIAKIENGKILGIKEGTTTITGVSSDGLTTYEIVINVIKNPVTSSIIYVGIGFTLILILGTVIYLYYKKKFSNL